MKIIKLTNKRTNAPVYININHIGHFYEHDGMATIGVTTHNNGGLEVKESPEEILKLIKEAKAI
jgi:hypothetical protein